jgi:hypothetical protein
MSLGDVNSALAIIGRVENDVSIRGLCDTEFMRSALEDSQQEIFIDSLDPQF